MFRVFLTNFGFFLQEAFDNIDEAIVKGRNCGFEYAVYNNDSVVYINGRFI